MLQRKTKPLINQNWSGFGLEKQFTGRTDVEAETAIRWPPDVESRLFGKDPDAGKD